MTFTILVHVLKILWVNGYGHSSKWCSLGTQEKNQTFRYRRKVISYLICTLVDRRFGENEVDRHFDTWQVSMNASDPLTLAFGLSQSIH